MTNEEWPPFQPEEGCPEGVTFDLDTLMEPFDAISTAPDTESEDMEATEVVAVLESLAETDGEREARQALYLS
jgi:hypothetical protein